MLYLTSVVGAPTPTAVYFSEENVELIDWEKISYKIYDYLSNINISFSKIALISYVNDHLYNFKFVQIRSKGRLPRLETACNCGNSMVAAARVAFLLENDKNNYPTFVTIKNVDTDFTATIFDNDNNYSMRVDSVIGKAINPEDYNFKNGIVTYNDKEYNVSLLDVVNPYIIVNAKEIGIKTKEELLQLHTVDDNYIDTVLNIREEVIDKFNYNKDSEFPKIAVVNNNKTFAARTIYLGDWHKGLPLTAIITIMVASYIDGCVIYSDFNHKEEILTAKGKKKIRIFKDENNIIRKFEIFDIQANGSIQKLSFE